MANKMRRVVVEVELETDASIAELRKATLMIPLGVVSSKTVKAGKPLEVIETPSHVEMHSLRRTLHYVEKNRVNVIRDSKKPR